MSEYRDRYVGRYHVSLKGASRLLDLPESDILEFIKTGQLLSIYINGKTLLSRTELLEFAKVKHITLTQSIKPSKTILLVGKQLYPYRNKKRTYVGNLTVFKRKWLGFDGMIYATYPAIAASDYESLLFVCEAIYRYNSIVIRFRPTQSLRHLLLCYNPKTKTRLQALKLKLDRLFPGVSRLININTIQYQFNRMESV